MAHKARTWFAGFSFVTFVAGTAAFRFFADWYARVRARESADAVDDVPFDTDRPTIVIVHGLGGSSYQVDSMLSPSLIPFANVVAIDLPGHGGSPASRNGDYSIEAQAQELRELISMKLSRKGVESCVLFGISFGGELLTRVMIDLGRGADADFQVDAFIAYEPPYRGEYAQRWQRDIFKLARAYYWALHETFLRGSPTAQRLVVELFARFIRVIGGVGQIRHRLRIPVTHRKDKELFEHFGRHNDDHLDWEQWLENINGILTYDGAEHIGDFLPGVAVLLLSGEESTDPLVNTVKRLAEDLPESVPYVEIREVPGGHHATYERPEIIAQYIREFLQEEEIL